MVSELLLRDNDILYDEEVDISDDIDQLTGVLLEGFMLNSRVDIEDNDLFADFRGIPTKRINGIQLEGGNVGAGTTIRIQKENSIRVFENNQQLPSWGIYINGRFPPGSSTRIHNNLLLYRKQNSGATGGCILAEGGNKNNLFITDNLFEGGEDKRGTGISIIGGSNTNIEIFKNRFPVDFSTLFNIDFNFGIRIQGTDNLLICDNSLGNADRGFVGFGNNLLTELTLNTFTGSFNVHIAGGFIDRQTHAGNSFTPKFNFVRPSTGFAVCDQPDLASISLFTVHTPQSQEINLPPWYSFFSPFHPSRVVPDVMDEFFFPDLSGTPANACITRFGEYENPVHQSIANGTIDSLITDPAVVWELERSLYAKLKAYPSVVPAYPGYPTFLNQEDLTAIGKLYLIEEQIDRSFSPSVSLNQTSLNGYNTKDSLVMELIKNDSTIYTTQDSVALDSAYAYKADLLDAMIALDTVIADLQDSFKGEWTKGLTQAFNQNAAFTALNPWGNNTQIVHETYLQSLLFQSGRLTENQLNQLQSIALQCPKLAGAAVYEARALLPSCLRAGFDDHYEGCYPEIEGALEEGEERSNAEIAFQKEVQIFPNPSQGDFTIWMGQEAGILRIFDSQGAEVLSRPIQGKLALNIAENGLYHCRIERKGKAPLNYKIIIAK